MRRSIGISIVLLLVALSGRAAPAVAGTITGSTRLTGHVLPALDFSTPVQTAATAPSDPLTLTVILNRADQRGFDALLQSIEDPSSSTYQRYLTQQQLADRFGPSQSAYNQVLSWLQGQGFALVEGSANRLTLTVRGTRQQAARAFSVQINDYQSNGRRFYANDSDPVLPTTIAKDVQAIVGLSDLTLVQTAKPTVDKIRQICEIKAAGVDALEVLGLAKLFEKLLFRLTISNSFPVIGQGALAFCLGVNIGTFYHEHYYDCAVDAGANDGVEPASDCAKNFPFLAKGTYPLAPGSGPSRTNPARTAGSARPRIGFLEFDAFNSNDIVDWLRLVGYTATPANHLTVHPINGGVAAPGPEEGEVVMDIDIAMALAPAADFAVYEAPRSTSFQALFNAMINDGDTVISNSWAYCESQTTLADVQSLDSILAGAAAAGISIFNGSGDTGSTCLGFSPNTVAVPADSPHATAVGGTTPTFGTGLVYGSEAWWDGSSHAPTSGQGGFGTSAFFSRPAYQNGFTTSPMRSVPDLAVAADPAEGLRICQADAGGCPIETLSGGTSLAAPELAAFTAVLTQSLGHNLGNLNVLVYPLATTSAFHSPASMQSDFAHVGLGSPNIDQLNLALASQVPGPVSSQLSSVVDSGPVSADGAVHGIVQVNLLDANGHAVSGKSVSLSASSGSHAQFPNTAGLSSPDGGAVTFLVTDSTIENVTFTATDSTDGVLIGQTTLHFASPPATSGGITASPPSISADGHTTSTIAVTLLNAKGQGASGKTVTLSQGAGHSDIFGPTPAVTDSNGQVSFQVADVTTESVTYTAEDVTDGVPAPGTATVSFTSGGSGWPCRNGAPAAAPGYAYTSFATGFGVNNFCIGPNQPSFDSVGNLYFWDFYDEMLYRIPPQGGVASAATRVSTAPMSGLPGGMVFGNDGRLYTALYNGGSVIEVDKNTGALLRTVASGIPCAGALAPDPLTGDLFVNQPGCTGAILRIANPTGQTPTVSTYASPGATQDLIFGPDGTLYTEAGTGNTLLKIGGTNTPPPAAVTTIATVPGGPDGAGVSIGQPQFFFVNRSDGTITKVDTGTSPATLSTVFSGGSRGGFAVVGPDGCFYADQSDRVLKITNVDGSCPFATATAAPQVSLTPAQVASNPAQGIPVTFTATLTNISNPASTPVFFEVAGANSQSKLVHADANGVATLTYTGVATGRDIVVATINTGATSAISNRGYVTWAPGNHTTFSTLNPSATAGYPNQPVTVTGNLSDLSTQPAATPLAGQTLAFSLSGAGGSCTGMTDATGAASCTLTPTAAPGSYTLTVTFSATGQYLASSDATGFTLAAGSKPVLQTVTPANGAAEGGKPISIAGSNIQPGASVSIGGRLAGNIVVGAGGASVSATTPSYLYWGDVNGDTLATVLDALCLLRAIVGLPETPNCPASGFQVTLPLVVSNPGGGSAVVPGGYTYNTGDLTGNGPLSVLDALCLLRSIVGLSATQNCPAPVPPGSPPPGQSLGEPPRR